MMFQRSVEKDYEDKIRDGCVALLDRKDLRSGRQTKSAMSCESKRFHARHHIRKRGMGQPLLFSVLIPSPLHLELYSFKIACNLQFVMEPLQGTYFYNVLIALTEFVFRRHAFFFSSHKTNTTI